MKKKILVRGPALSQTGYGEQCRFALRALRSREDLFDIHLYYQVSDKLGRERISDLKTHEELCKLSTLNKINLFENPDIYKEWMESDYMPEVLKKGFKRNGQRFKN